MQTTTNPAARAFSSNKVERVHDFLTDGLLIEDMPLVPALDQYHLSRLVGIGRIATLSQEG